MPQKTAIEIKRFAIPFAISSEKGKAPYTSEMELAAIFSIAEMDRKKGGLLRGAEEKITFISKIGYPLWLYSISKDVFLFDGLDVSDYAVQYAAIPEVKSFIDDLKVSSKKREGHMIFLDDHINYFDKSKNENTFRLKGIIAKNDFLEEFGAHRQDAIEREDSIGDMALLSSPIDQNKLLSATHEIDYMRSIFEKELKELSTSIQLLGKASTNFHKELHEEITSIKEEFSLKIKQEEIVVAPIIKRLREEHDRKIVAISRSMEQQEIPLQTEKIKLERMKRELTAKILKYKQKTPSDKESEIEREKWKRKINEAKQEFSEASKTLKRNEKAIEELAKEKAAETFRVKSELENEIKEARQKIVDLEASRDAKILIMRQEIDKLDKNTKLLSDQINKVIKVREEDLAKFNRLSMNSLSKDIDKSLVYVPFYVISYDSGSKKRYEVLPPTVLSPLDISTKLKGAFGAARIRSFLAPRYKEISKLGDTIEELTKNSVFETELNTLGKKNNILSGGWIASDIEKGLFCLKEQNWLSSKEYGTIIASAHSILKGF